MSEKNKPLPGPGTIVGANVKLTGALKDINDITVHGQIDGEVTSDKNILVAENASIKGPVSAQTITVAGKVNGTINAVQKLELLPQAKVDGSISTRDLIIRSGAIFNGKCQMSKEAVQEKAEITSKEKIKESQEPNYELE